MQKGTCATGHWIAIAGYATAFVSITAHRLSRRQRYHRRLRTITTAARASPRKGGRVAAAGN